MYNCIQRMHQNFISGRVLTPSLSPTPWLGCFNNPFLSLFIFSTEQRKGWKHPVFCKRANSLHMSLSEKHVRQHEAAPGLVRSYLATIGRVIDEHCRIWESDPSRWPYKNHNRKNMKLKIQQRIEYLQEKMSVVTILFAEFDCAQLICSGKND